MEFDYHEHEVFELLEELAKKSGINDFMIDRFDGCTLRLTGSFDLGYYHEVEVEFDGVDYMHLPTYFSYPRIYLIKVKAAPENSVPSLPIRDYGIFEDGEGDIQYHVRAFSVRARRCMVYHYDRSPLEAGEELSDAMKSKKAGLDSVMPPIVADMVGHAVTVRLKSEISRSKFDIDDVIDIEVRFANGGSVVRIPTYTFRSQLEDNAAGLREFFKQEPGAEFTVRFGAPDGNDRSSRVDILLKRYHSNLVLAICHTRQECDQFGKDLVSDTATMHLRTDPHCLLEFAGALDRFALGAEGKIRLRAW